MAFMDKSSVQILFKNKLNNKETNSLYIKFEVDEAVGANDLDDYDVIIDKYTSLIANSNYEDP